MRDLTYKETSRMQSAFMRGYTRELEKKAFWGPVLKTLGANAFGIAKNMATQFAVNTGVEEGTRALMGVDDGSSWKQRAAARGIGTGLMTAAQGAASAYKPTTKLYSQLGKNEPNLTMGQKLDRSLTHGARKGIKSMGQSQNAMELGIMTALPTVGQAMLGI